MDAPAMIDIKIFDAVPIGLHQRRHIAVHVIEIRKHEEHIAPKDFDAAA